MSYAMETEKQAAEREYTQAEDTDEGRVHTEHAALRETVKRLEHQVARLTERLVKVLQPESPNAVIPGMLTGVEQKSISPLAARLQDDAQVVNRVADRVSELIGRLEV